MLGLFWLLAGYFGYSGLFWLFVIPKVWHASCLAKPPLPSPMEYGWRTVEDSLHPVYFEGNMSAEFLCDLVCSCQGKSQCKKSCVCANVDTSDKLIPLQRPSRNCNTLAFSIPSCRTSIQKESFYPKTTKDWNALKDASVGAPSLVSVSKLPVPFLTSL